MTHLNSRLAIMSGIDPQRVRLQVFLASAPITAAALIINDKYIVV